LSCCFFLIHLFACNSFLKGKFNVKESYIIRRERRLENSNKISNYLIKVIINGNAGLFRPFFLFVILFQLSGCKEKGTFANVENL
jgi:hypothetical protein